MIVARKLDSAVGEGEFMMMRSYIENHRLPGWNAQAEQLP
jgi:hypothetical protein